MGAGHKHHHHEHSQDCDHGSGHDHGHSHKGGPALRRALALTFTFMFVEFIGGWYSGSLALMTDATHMLADSGALLLSLFALWVSERPSTPAMSYGYHRAEILGALASGLLIWMLAGLIIWEAVERISNPQPIVAPVMLAIAVVGLFLNFFTMRILHGSHEHSLNVRAAYLHVLGDLLGSVGAIVAGIVTWTTGFMLADPMVSLLVAALVLWSSWKLVVEAVGVLMESVPSGMDLIAIKKDLALVPGVKEVHDLHIWTVASGRIALSTHLVADASLGATDGILEQAHQVLQSRHGIKHVTIQVERDGKFASDGCHSCT